MFYHTVSVILVCVLLSGCSTYRSAEMTPEQTQQKIAAGELANAGDKIRITTTDNETYVFKVTSVTDDTIVADRVSIPIENVVTVETLEFSAGKTAATVGGGTVLWAVLVAVALGGTLAL